MFSFASKIFANFAVIPSFMLPPMPPGKSRSKAFAHGHAFGKFMRYRGEVVKVYCYQCRYTQQMLSAHQYLNILPAFTALPEAVWLSARGEFK